MYTFLCISGCILSVVFLIIFSAYCKTKRELIITSKELLNVKNQIKNLSDTENLYERLAVDDIKLEIGKGLLSIASPDKDGELFYKIAAMRQRLTDDIGYIIPNIRICDSEKLGENEFTISVHDNKVMTDYIYPDRLLTFIDDYEKNNINVPEDKICCNTYRHSDSCWITKEDAKKLSENIECKEPVDVMIDYIKDVVIEYVNDILTIKETNKYIESVRKNYSSEVVGNMLEILSVNTVRQVLANLIREEVSIKDTGFIFEKLTEYARFSQEADILSERLRCALSQQIMNKNTVYNTLFGVTIKQDWEQLLDEACERTEIAVMFILSPLQIQTFIERVVIALTEVSQKINRQPVILCSPRIRLPLYQLLVRHIPNIVVISYSELTTNIKVEAVDEIGKNDIYENIKNL